MRARLLRYAFVLALAPTLAAAQPAQGTGPYRVIRTAKVGGVGGFDYVSADAVRRHLYVARLGTDSPRLTVFNLDTLAPAGEIAGYSAHGAAVDQLSHHGFATSQPVMMWDTRSLTLLKTIPVGGNPDGIMADAFNHRIYVLSHSTPNMTAINAADGSIAGTINLGAAPEQTVTDGKGHLYVDLEDKDQVAVVDAKTMAVTARYALDGKGGTPAGLAFDARNRILFVACRNPATMVMLNADTGTILGVIPIGVQVDGAVFNPATMEAISSQGDGTLSIIKEESPTSFVLEQTLQTQPSAKTLTLDAKTGHIFLIAAEFALPPADAPPLSAGRVARGPMVPDSFAILEVGR
jgi:DNA-binding beta-propeller fold protein YncE